MVKEMSIVTVPYKSPTPRHSARQPHDTKKQSALVCNSDFMQLNVTVVITYYLLLNHHWFVVVVAVVVLVTVVAVLTVVVAEGAVVEVEVTVPAQGVVGHLYPIQKKSIINTKIL
jgi:hypothetical protein